MKQACDFSAVLDRGSRPKDSVGDTIEAEAEAHEADSAFAGSIGEGNAVIVFGETSAARPSTLLALWA